MAMPSPSGSQVRLRGPVTRRKSESPRRTAKSLPPGTRTSDNAALLVADEAEDRGRGKIAVRLRQRQPTIAFILQPPQVRRLLGRPSTRPPPPTAGLDN